MFSWKRRGSAGRSSLAGLTFVVTGKLERFSRSEIEERQLERCHVQRKPQNGYVVVGEKAGSKLIAPELDVAVLSRGA